MDFGATHARSRKVSDGIVKGVHFLMKKNKITEIDGWGTFTGPKAARREGCRRQHHVVHLRQHDPGDRCHHPADPRARRSPSGSSPTRSRSSTTPCPDSIIIAGSGAIGVEFAYVMKNFGVDVTIVEFLDRMVPTEDEEVSKELAKHYKKLGVKVMTSTKVESIDDSGDKVKVTVSTGRRPAGPRGRQGAPGDRLPAAPRGLRPGEHRRRRPPTAAPSRSTPAAAPTSTASTPSVTSPAS